MKKLVHTLSLLLGLGLFAYAQPLPDNLSEPTALKSSDEHGIFSIKDTAKATSRAEFSIENSGGTITYQTTRTGTNTLKVNFAFDRNEVPNPLHVYYDFEIRQLANGDFEMDMKGAMPFMFMYIGTETEILYNGTHLSFPNMLTIGEELPSTKGEFTLQSKLDKSRLLSYQVEIKNRKIIKKESLSIDGKSYDAYVHTYDFAQTIITNENRVLSISNEQVTEWLIPNYGLVQQDREGTYAVNKKHDRAEEILKSSQRSQLLTIQN